MPTIETKIWLALQSRIAGLLPGVAKAMPGMLFTPSANTPYLRVGKVQTAPSRVFIADGKPHERTGTLILTFVAPVGLQSTAYYEEMQGQIAAHFKDGTQMRYQDICVSVPSYPHCVEGYLDDGWWTAPVSIPWRCYA